MVTLMSEENSLREDLLKAVAQINAYYEELEGESPRAAAILAVASLEDELEKLILFKKFPKTIQPSVWKKIAGAGPTPLGSLKAKTDFGLAFDFYGRKTSSIINTIATVRNKFAHETDVRDFDHPRVLEECIKLAPNPISPFVCTLNTQPKDIRLGFLMLVEKVEKRLAEVREYLPELGDQRPDPLP